jgi:hypothetical protein
VTEDGQSAAGAAVFSREDLDTVSEVVAAAWRSGRNRDWSAPAGTLDWTCTKTADHTVDSVLAVAFFLASRRQDNYPDWGWGELTMGAAARPELLIEAVESVGRVLSGVVATTGPDVRAVIWRRPRIETRGPEDFAPRGALELLLHGHDVASGLGVAFDPPDDVCARLRDHTRGWPHWSADGRRLVRPAARLRPPPVATRPPACDHSVLATKLVADTPKIIAKSPEEGRERTVGQTGRVASSGMSTPTTWAMSTDERPMWSS